MKTPGRNRIGTTQRWTASFVNNAGAYVDPTTVVAKVKTPAGTITSYAYGVASNVGKSATGRYFIDIAPTEGGRWFIRGEATSGTDQLALEDDHIIQNSPFVGNSWATGDYA